MCADTISVSQTVHLFTNSLFPHLDCKVSGVTNTFKMNPLNYRFLCIRIRTHSQNCNDWHSCNHSNICRVVSAIFHQSNVTATKDSLCSSILTKPPSSCRVLFMFRRLLRGASSWPVAMSTYYKRCLLSIFGFYCLGLAHKAIQFLEIIKWAGSGSVIFWYMAYFQDNTFGFKCIMGLFSGAAFYVKIWQHWVETYLLLCDFLHHSDTHLNMTLISCSVQFSTHCITFLVLKGSYYTLFWSLQSWTLQLAPNIVAPIFYPCPIWPYSNKL